MNFEESVQYLFGLGHETLAMKLGLKTTELLLETLQHPEQSFKSVQIAGTNGKGSVAAFLNSICLAANIKTGLYTSPHLSSITERIKIAGVEIEREEFACQVDKVRAAAEGLVASNKLEALPTFFEQVTVAALVAFREANVELAVLETGLGGRLDSTTAARAQIVAITPIDLDHEEYLGNTIESIAAEKAAIIRPGVVAVIAPQQTDALRVITTASEASGVSPILNQVEIHNVRSTCEGNYCEGNYCVTFETETDVYEDVCVALRGRHQIENAAVAIQLAEQLRTKGFAISHKAIVNGIESARHPGRLELFKHHEPQILLDGAHNPAGARTLREYLESVSVRPLVLVFGAMKEKKSDEIARILFPLADHVILTTVQNSRSLGLEDLRALRIAAGVGMEVVDSSQKAFAQALELAGQKGLVCITGSLYLIGELREMILDLTL